MKRIAIIASLLVTAGLGLSACGSSHQIKSSSTASSHHSATTSATHTTTSSAPPSDGTTPVKLWPSSEAGGPAYQSAGAAHAMSVSCHVNNSGESNATTTITISDPSLAGKTWQASVGTFDPNAGQNGLVVTYPADTVNGTGASTTQTVNDDLSFDISAEQPIRDDSDGGVGDMCEVEGITSNGWIIAGSTSVPTGGMANTNEMGVNVGPPAAQGPLTY